MQKVFDELGLEFTDEVHCVCVCVGGGGGGGGGGGVCIYDRG